MDHKVIGTTMPVLEMQLAAGESVVAQGGELSWMTGANGKGFSLNLGGDD